MVTRHKPTPNLAKGKAPAPKETLEQMLMRTRGYGLGQSDPKIPYDGRFDRVRYWSTWGKTVRATTPVVGIRSEHF